GEAYFCIVDLHSITVEYDPADLRERSLDLAAIMLASGLDPERSTLFLQSHVTAHAEAAWLLAAVTSMGELRRMTQFKDKSDRQDAIVKKFKTAVTDSGREIRHDPEKPGVSNLIEILSVATGETFAQIEARYDGKGYGDLKGDVAEAVVELLRPLRERYTALR